MMLACENSSHIVALFDTFSCDVCLGPRAPFTHAAGEAAKERLNRSLAAGDVFVGLLTGQGTRGKKPAAIGTGAAGYVKLWPVFPNEESFSTVKGGEPVTWLPKRQGRFEVSSIIIRGERNYLLNPADPRFAQLTWSEPQPFRFDPRLLSTHLNETRRSFMEAMLRFAH